MAHPRSPTFRFRRRRGGVYIMTLAVGMIISVIGLSAVLLVRIQRRRTSTATDAVRARAAAISLVDLGVYRIANDPNWRTTYTHDAWTAEEELFGLTGSLKLCDEQDGDLANDNTQPVRLYARVATGQAARIVSLLLRPGSRTGEVLANGNMEDGVNHWRDGGTCQLESQDKQEEQYVGQNMKIKDRDTPAAGPIQDITGRIAANKTYYTEAWVKMKDQAEPVIFVLYTNSTVDGPQEVRWTSPAVGTIWTRVSTTMKPTWSGTLLSAHWRVETPSTDQEFHLDEVLLHEGTTAAPQAELTPVPGTWRQEVGP